MKSFFDDVPFVGWVITGWRSQAFVMKHQLLLSAAWASIDQLAQIIYHQMRTMLPKLFGVTLARDADHKPKFPRSPCLDPGEGVLDDDRPCRFSSEKFCRCQEGIWSGFSRQVLRVHHVADRRRMANFNM